MEPTTKLPAWLLLTRRSLEITVVLSDALLLPAPVLPGSVGSVTPAGAITRAVLVKVPDCGAVPVTVKVTVAPEGSVVMVLVTLLPATLTGPHTAPPVAEPQEAATPVTTPGTLSLNCARLAACGPAFETTIV